MCPKLAKQFYTEVRDKTSAGKKTHALTIYSDWLNHVEDNGKG